MYCRERLLGNAMPVECSLNPRLGREYRYRWQEPPEERQQPPRGSRGRRPRGLECAVILAKRGFAVTLLEKEAALGGTLNIAKLPPHKANLQDVTDVLALEARELGVTVKLNTEATPETVAALHPVGVFLAARCCRRWCRSPSPASTRPCWRRTSSWVRPPAPARWCWWAPA